MSLLEDIFLRDEADEAKELERIIEGDEYDDKPLPRSDSDDNSEKDDEAEEEKRRVDPSSTKTKRTVKNPRFILNPARLTGPRGIQVIPDHFKDFKFKGKGHEKEDLDLVLKKLEHWAYRLYPKFKFEDCLKKIETLGKKRPVMVHLHKIRSDQYISEETVVQKDSSDDESAPVEREEDEFDKLLQQQIDLARSTPGPGSARKPVLDNSIMDRSSFNAPKATSSPSISDEQRERMMRSRKLAEERRLARLKNNSNVSNNALSSNKENIVVDINEEYIADKEDDQTMEENIEMRVDTDDILVSKKHKTNVIDSSDDEDGVMSVNESVTVDIHTAFSNGSNIVPIGNTKSMEENETINNCDNIDDLGVNNAVGNINKENQLFDELRNTSNNDNNSLVNNENNIEMETTNAITNSKNLNDREEISSIDNTLTEYQVEVGNHEQISKPIEPMADIEHTKTAENIIKSLTPNEDILELAQNEHDTTNTEKSPGTQKSLVDLEHTNTVENKTEPNKSFKPNEYVMESAQNDQDTTNIENSPGTEESIIDIEHTNTVENTIESNKRLTLNEDVMESADNKQGTTNTEECISNESDMMVIGNEEKDDVTTDLGDIMELDFTEDF
ncbi:unnamed protein product [Parnassius apollo]|uniref:TIMELESS-interacting protein n=1 Tax=Parnassius apollo TaxID=110799 RepID=A0A8S3X3I7_PARAO|nr:unnamed protein product [Parnassius apollo]